RLAHGERLPACHWDRVAERTLGRACVVAKRVDHHLDLAARAGERLTGVAGLELCELLCVLLERGGELAQRPRTRRGCERSPGRKARPSARDRSVQLLLRRGWKLGKRPLGGGLDHGDHRQRCYWGGDQTPTRVLIVVWQSRRRGGRG